MSVETRAKGRSFFLLGDIQWDQMSSTFVDSPDSTNSKLCVLLQEAQFLPIRHSVLSFIAAALIFRSSRFFIQFSTLWPKLFTTPRLSDPSMRNTMFCLLRPTLSILQGLPGKKSHHSHPFLWAPLWLACLPHTPFMSQSSILISPLGAKLCAPS